MNVDVSPDGEMLIFDLLGDIYWLPIAGGDAVALTSGRAWDQAPCFSPDGAQVYFVSDREGYKNIWRLTLADQSLQRITASDSDVLGGPNWSQDSGDLLAGIGDAYTRNTEVILQSINPNNGSMMPLEKRTGPWIDMDTFTRLRQPTRTFSGVQTADGQAYFSETQIGEKLGHTTGRLYTRLYTFDVNSQTRTAITPADALYSEYKPQLSHDGQLLAYFRQYNDRRTEIRILNRSTRQDKALIALMNADDAPYVSSDDSRPNYAFAPDDRKVIFWHDGKIHRVNLADGSSEIVPFRVKVEREVWARVQPTVQRLSDNGEAKIIRWPSMSRDAQTMAFAAIGYVWVMGMKTGAVQRLTNSTDFEYMPAISPDGTMVAFISFAKSGNGYGPGRLIVSDVDDGKRRDLLGASNEIYLLPKWSQDGQKIAVIKEVENESGLEATFGWTPAISGAFYKVAAAPASSDFASLQIYARFVGFDEAGRNVLFGFPRSKTETVLASAGLDGGAQRTLAISTPEIGGITPAPDLNHLALTRDDGTVWVVPFAVGEGQSVVSTWAPDARRISDGGGYYVDWNHPNQISYSFGQNVHRYHLDRDGSESLSVQVSFAKPKVAQSIAFTGARLITMSGDGAGPVIESGTIVLESQRIAAVGPVGDVPIPTSAVVIDATGKTIMPGLLDTHYHRIGGPGVSALKLPNAKFSDRSAIVYGVTSAWEPGGPANDAVPATVDLQAAGRIAGPRWSHSAKGAIGFPYELLTTYAAALAAVDQHRELGVAVLKEYVTPTRQQQQWLSAAARETGVGIVSHLQTFDGMMTRIVDGYTGGDHPYIPVPFFKDVHELLRQTGYVWTPNIRITPGTLGIEESKIDYFCQAVLTWQDRVGLRDWEDDPICPVDQRRPTVPYDILRFSRVARQAASAARNGVHVGVSAHSMPGWKLHQEMWYLWRGGLAIEGVLRATTIGNAEKLGLQEEIGSLEPGKIADFLVLNGNPLDNILNTLSLTYTVQGGVVYDSTTAQRADLTSLRETDVATRHPDE